MMASRLGELRRENERLKKAIIELSERQEVLEEFIDLEHDPLVLKVFRENRHRMKFLLGYTKEDLDIETGKRSPKSVELVRLLKIVSRYQKRPFSDRKKKGKKFEVYPSELHRFKVGVDTCTGIIFRKPPKRCEKCYDLGHLARECPYKYEASRTPEVKLAILQRKNEAKEVEINDPLLSKKYKKRHYHHDPKKAELIKKKRKERQELNELKIRLEANGMTPSEAIAHISSLSNK